MTLLHDDLIDFLLPQFDNFYCVVPPLVPHGVGHSLGMDVHDVPSASKPVGADGKVLPYFESDLARKSHTSFYTYLRLRRVIETGMVVVRLPSIILNYPGGP